jgi:hypothetical protein
VHGDGTQSKSGFDQVAYQEPGCDAKPEVFVLGNQWQSLAAQVEGPPERVILCEDGGRCQVGQEFHDATFLDTCLHLVYPTPFCDAVTELDCRGDRWGKTHGIIGKQRSGDLDCGRSHATGHSSRWYDDPRDIFETIHQIVDEYIEEHGGKGSSLAESTKELE